MSVKNILMILWMTVMCVSCIQRVDFNTPVPNQYIVVEGHITNAPPPYTVRITRGLGLDESVTEIQMLSGVSVVLMDDLGNTESLTETENGIYQSGGLIQGTVGRSYHIVIETPDGRIYESAPDELKPVGVVEQIKIEYEERVSEDEFGIVPDDVFNVFIDADAGVTGNDHFIRWKFIGTYKVTTNPELNFFWAQGGGVNKIKIPDPLPCSGFEVSWNPAPSLYQVGDCICCTCYPNEYEEIPQLSDLQLVEEGKFQNIKVGEVPINRTTFEDKYLVTVQQLSMTRSAFEFFKLVREQKEGAADIFQPIFGEISGNIHGANTNIPAIGIFWASAISEKSRFIYREDVPYGIAEKNVVRDDCREAYAFSTTDIPVAWQ